MKELPSSNALAEKPTYASKATSSETASGASTTVYRQGRARRESQNPREWRPRHPVQRRETEASWRRTTPSRSRRVAGREDRRADLEAGIAASTPSELAIATVGPRRPCRRRSRADPRVVDDRRDRFGRAAHRAERRLLARLGRLERLGSGKTGEPGLRGDLGRSARPRAALARESSSMRFVEATPMCVPMTARTETAMSPPRRSGGCGYWRSA